MIWQQRPGIHGHGSVLCQVPEPGDKIISICCVQEDLLSFNTPAHDMMEHPGSLPKADKRLIELTLA
jgi:hypothetical protein